MTPDEYINTMARVAGIHRRLFMSKKRDVEYMIPRHVLAWKMHKDGVPVPDVAKVIERSRATVIHSCQLMDSAMENPLYAPTFYKLAQKYEQEIARINGRNQDPTGADSSTDCSGAAGTHDTDN